eukprot:TRINITY_DN3266_c0_g1_i2.p1 TRINITY_DN3266_c0_g1~~TRINITY_DN3266_c0_g1_i2.p1  ORF type:complete len:326 (-),score=111.23 TRINITY_DN3266_c0_g1_i2:81-1058(-)
MTMSLYSHIGVPDRIVTVDHKQILASHRWLPNTPSNKSPFTFEFDPILGARNRIGVALNADINIPNQCFQLSIDGKTLFSCGYWDDTFKVHQVDNSKLVQSITSHKDVVTCLALGQFGKTLVTGSRDTTLLVWEMKTSGGMTTVNERVKHVLSGHDDEVTCVTVSNELDIVASGSKDGSVIIHTLRQGNYVRSMFHPQNRAINLLTVSGDGLVIAYSWDDLLLHVYSINGKHLYKSDTYERLTAIAVSKDGYLVTGGEKCTVVIRELPGLEVVHKYVVKSPVSSLTITPDQNNLMVGLEDGKLLIFACAQKIGTGIVNGFSGLQL